MEKVKENLSVNSFLKQLLRFLHGRSMNFSEGQSLFTGAPALLPSPPPAALRIVRIRFCFPVNLR